MYLKRLLVIFLAPIFLFSCVSAKKLKASEERYVVLNRAYLEQKKELTDCQNSASRFESQQSTNNAKVDALNKEIDYLKKNNNLAISQLQDLSVISSSQAESIRKSIDNISSKDAYIQGLQSAMNRKDSLNLALVQNLKGAIGNLSDDDINIKVDKGVVYIDISDKLLFRSGSYVVTDRASEVLGKVAMVLKNQPDIEFMVEGHTDNVPFRNGLLLDNWDLSVKRATSVVRILQDQYGIPPTHMTAAGRSEYIPVTTNDTSEGRAANRRTRIVILPQLDQFFKLLERK